jgi:hypothetical protein
MDRIFSRYAIAAGISTLFPLATMTAVIVPLGREKIV